MANPFGITQEYAGAVPPDSPDFPRLQQLIFATRDPQTPPHVRQFAATTLQKYFPTFARSATTTPAVLNKDPEAARTARAGLMAATDPFALSAPITRGGGEAGFPGLTTAIPTAAVAAVAPLATNPRPKTVTQEEADRTEVKPPGPEPTVKELVAGADTNLVVDNKVKDEFPAMTATFKDKDGNVRDLMSPAGRAAFPRPEKMQMWDRFADNNATKRVLNEAPNEYGIGRQTLTTAGKPGRLKELTTNPAGGSFTMMTDSPELRARRLTEQLGETELAKAQALVEQLKAQAEADRARAGLYGAEAGAKQTPEERQAQTTRQATAEQRVVAAQKMYERAQRTALASKGTESEALTLDMMMQAKEALESAQADRLLTFPQLGSGVGSALRAIGQQ